MGDLPDLRDVEKIVERVLQYVHSFDEMYYFTDHSIFHSRRVLEHVESIIRICEINGIPLNEPEKSILKCACFLHDLGCIRGRNNHALESVRCIHKLCDMGEGLWLGPIKDHIDYVVHTHSSNGLAIGEVRATRPVTGFPEKVRLKFLCALFKLADECDIDKRRVNKPLYHLLEDKMPDTSKQFWQGHERVIFLEFSPDNQIVIHLTSEDLDWIADSLKKTLEEIKEIFIEYGFPYTNCRIEYEPYDEVEIDI